MLYFCATSVFHIVLILYLFSTVYKEDQRERKLILLDSVTGLMHIKDVLNECGIFDEIITLCSGDCSPSIVQSQINQIQFSKDDIYHMFGMEPYSVCLLKRANRVAKTIVVEEGMLWFCDLEKTIDDYNMRQKMDDFKLVLSDFQEVWKMGRADSFLTDHIKCRDLHMPKYLNDDVFREKFIAVLEKIFSKEDTVAYYGKNIIFDSYFRQMRGGYTRKFEIELLLETVKCFGNNDVWIKPHPGENDFSKYENVTNAICEKSFVPWEVVHLYEWKAKKKLEPKILLCFYPTGAMIDEEFLFEEKTSYIIYLYKIYQRLGICVSDFYNRFKYIEEDIKHAHNVFLPESFTELRRIITSINGEEMDCESFQKQFQDEQNFFLQWFIEDYQNNLSLRPLEKNITTLFGIDNEVPVVQEELEFDTTIQHEKIEFIVKDVELLKYRWYIARERKVNIYKIHVCYEDSNGEIRNVLPDKIHFLNQNDRQQEWIEFLDFDSCVDIEVEEACFKIIIWADIRFDDDYSSIARVSRELGNRFEDLAHVQEKERGALHFEIDRRDKLIKEIVEQRESINDTLISERKQYEETQLKLKQTQLKLEETNLKLEKIQNENEILNEAVSSFRNYVKYKKRKDFR